MTTKIPFGQASMFHLLDATELPDNVVLTHNISDDDFNAFVSEWLKQPVSAFDLETAGVTSKKDALDYFRLRIRLLQVGYKGKCYVFDAFKETQARKQVFFKAVKEMLTCTKRIVVLHNGFFDLSILRCQANIRAKGIRDTCVMSKMLNAGIGMLRPNDLGSAVKQFLGVHIDKSHQVDDWSTEYLSNAQYLYAANDVLYTEKLFYAQVKECRAVGSLDISGKVTQYSFLDTVKLECEAIPAFVELLATGQPVDLKLCQDNIAKYQRAIDDLYAPMLAKLGLTYSASSPKLHAAIKAEYGIDVRDSKEKPTTSSDALFLAYTTSGNEDLLRLSLTRSLVKLRDTLQNLHDSAVQNKGFARGCYNSLGDKASGRSTCKGGGINSSLSALNLQNIPNNVIHPLLDEYNLPPLREVIRHTDADDVMYLFDLSASHARYAASARLSGDFKLVEVMEMDDPHSYLTLKLGAMNGKDWDLAYYEANCKKDPELKQMRSVAKVALYTQFNGGGGNVFYKNLLKAYVNVPLELCMQAKKALEDAFPQYSKWCNRNSQTLQHSSTIKVGYARFAQFLTPAGRLYHIEVQDKISKKGNPYKAVNLGEISSACLISIEAYAMKSAFIDAYDYLIANPTLPISINSFTHDDISITDRTPDRVFAQYVYDRIAYYFTETLGSEVPSTMAEGDGKWEKGKISDYSKK